jgi:hypothetical protein
MQLPALFYGLYRDVKPRTARIVNRISKGADWMALVEAEGFLDTATTPGVIVLDGPSPLLGGQPHFQAWLLWAQYRDNRAREWMSGRAELHDRDDEEEAMFQKSLTKPWSTLGLVGGRNKDWLFRENRHRPYLRAVRQYWDVFDSVGARYSTGQQNPVQLWAQPNTIKYVLANRGIPGDELDPPLPPGGLAELIDRTERHLH